MIELSELVAYVQSEVPKFSAELGGRGISTIMIRGFNDDRQSVHLVPQAKILPLSGGSRKSHRATHPKKMQATYGWACQRAR
jgi:hypothetical protein